MTLPATISNLGELQRTAELGMYRHYAAARRNRRLHRWVSVFRIVVSVALGSAFLYAIREELPSFAKWLAATLAFLAAAFGFLEMYFGFAKSFERHHRVANDYRAIARESERVRALFDDKLLELGHLAEHVARLHGRYDETTRGAEDLLTTQADYRRALGKQTVRQAHVEQRRAASDGGGAS
jgi:hypothetical protein